MRKTILAIVFYVLGCAAAQAQQDRLPTVKISDFDKYKDGVTKCWERTTMLEVIVQKTSAGEMITVVAHSGSSDINPGLSRRRLRNVHAYMTQYYARSPKTIGMVEGDPVEGNGRLDFYVGGRLVWVMYARPDSDIDFGDCYPPDDSFIRKHVYDPCWVKSHRIFYPCRDRYERRRVGRGQKTGD